MAAPSATKRVRKSTRASAPTTPKRVPKILGAVRDAAAALVAQQRRVPTSPPDRAALLYELDRVIDLAKKLRGEVAEAIVADLKATRGDHTMGEHVVTITARQDRKEYDHEALGLALAKRVSPKTPKANRAVVSEIVACAGIGYWRVTELRNRAIEVDEFCKKESSVPGVSAALLPEDQREPF